MLRVARFLHSFVRHPTARVVEREVWLRVQGVDVPASYIRPWRRGRLPGWIVLHGITVPGRQHPALRRFAHALASTGAAVLIPEVPAWRALRLDSAAGNATVEAAAEYLAARDDVHGASLNLVGFSFGATMALMSATRPLVRRSVRSVVGFGGYCDLERTLLYMMTGEHEWQGVTRRSDPDPYGRWIIVGNYLTDVPELAHMIPLQEAARELALESGRLGAYAGDAVYDPIKARLRKGLPPEQQALWDIIAPPFHANPPSAEARWLAKRLGEATVRLHPELNPIPRLADVDQKVVLVHGHDDRLIPYTETLRLQSHLGPRAEVTASITRLFAHSREADSLPVHAYPRELARYFALLRRALQPC